MALQPSSHLGMLMGSVIIHDKMKGNLPGELLVEGAQELEKLLMPMAFIALTDHLSLQGLQRIASCGGFKYSPITSVIFARNLGSRESLKDFTRWGLRLWACQMLLMVDLLTP